MQVYSRRYGPEHLVVQTENPEAEILCKLRDFFITTSKRKQPTHLAKAYLEKVVNAGSVFMGLELSTWKVENSYPSWQNVKVRMHQRAVETTPVVQTIDWGTQIFEEFGVQAQLWLLKDLIIEAPERCCFLLRECSKHTFARIGSLLSQSPKSISTFCLQMFTVCIFWRLLCILFIGVVPFLGIVNWIQGFWTFWSLIAMTQPLDGVRVVGLCMPKVFAQVCLPVVMPDNLVAFRQIRACLKAMRRESLNTTWRIFVHHRQDIQKTVWTCAKECDIIPQVFDPSIPQYKLWIGTGLKSGRDDKSLSCCKVFVEYWLNRLVRRSLMTQRYLKYVTVQKLTEAGLKRVGPHVEAWLPRKCSIGWDAATLSTEIVIAIVCWGHIHLMLLLGDTCSLYIYIYIHVIKLMLTKCYRASWSWIPWRWASVENTDLEPSIVHDAGHRRRRGIGSS